MQNLPMLNFGQLNRADIILTTQRNSLISAGIRTVTNSIISHSMLVSENLKVIEATNRGVGENDWNRAVEGATLAIAMRHRQVSNHSDQNRIVEIAKKYVGKKYDYTGAAGAGLSEPGGKILFGAGCIVNLAGCAFLLGIIGTNKTPVYVDNKFFCSELVSRAYREAGFPITKADPTNVAPCGIYNSTALKPVGCLINKPAPAQKDYPGWRKAKIG